MIHGLRPARPLAPLIVSPAILATWWLVAHNSGAGWVQALGDVVFGTLLIGVLGPCVILARAQVKVVAAPTDGTAGLPLEVRLSASTRLRIRPVVPPGPDVLIGPVGSRRAADDHVILLPRRRGIHDSVVLHISTAAPFGLQWWKRRVVVALPAALHIAPKCGTPMALAVQAREHAGESILQASAHGGEPRGARPYRPGDNRRHVHWRATAHTGELMVREMEGPAAQPVKVIVALPRDKDAAERVAERALGTIVRLLDRGAPVLLCTSEVSGPVEGAVDERRGAGRRLARAVAASNGGEATADGDAIAGIALSL